MKSDSMLSHKHPFLIIIALHWILAGCDDSKRQEVSTLRTNLDALSSKYDSVVQEKAKADSEVAKAHTELALLRERLAGVEAEAKTREGEVVKLKAALSAAEQRRSHVEELLKTAQSSERANREAASRREATLMADIDKMQKKNDERKGVVSGVVTYFFNNNYGYKPDIGASVLIVKKADHPGVNFNILPKFMLANSARSLMLTERQLKDTKSVGKKTLEGMGIKSEKDWENTVAEAKKVWRAYETGKNGIKLTVDGNGSFRRAVPPGEYYILVQSKQRQASNSLEILGKVYAAAIKVEGDEEVSVSAKFEAF
jgi:hypothetical protein